MLGLVLFSGLWLASCESKKETVSPTEEGVYNFWARIGDYPNSSTFIVQVPSLDTGALNYVGRGVEVDGILNYGLIKKGKYYYETVGNGKFGKYHVENEQLVVDKEVPFSHFGTDYAYTWNGDKLILFGVNGDGTQALYASIETNTMAITTGSIPLPAIPTGYDKYYLGFAQYRNDGRIFLGYNYGLASTWSVRDNQINVAVLNSETLQIEKTITDTRSRALSGVNNLFQDYYFLDSNSDLYFAAGPTSASLGATELSLLFRIKSGATEIDPTYSAGATNGKFFSGIWDLGNGKAIARLYDPTVTTSWVYKFYEVTLITGAFTELAIPACKAGSIQSVSVDGVGKAYIITNHEGNTDGYVYKYESGTVTKGMRVPSGYTWLLRIDKMEE